MESAKEQILKLDIISFNVGNIHPDTNNFDRVFEGSDADVVIVGLQNIHESQQWENKIVEAAHHHGLLEMMRQSNEDLMTIGFTKNVASECEYATTPTSIAQKLLMGNCSFVFGNNFLFGPYDQRADQFRRNVGTEFHASDVDYKFLFGCFNSKISFPDGVESNLENLLDFFKYDELGWALRAREIISNEMEIKFAPTAYFKDDGTYESPAWADRILFGARSSESCRGETEFEVEGVQYISYPDFTGIHKPVKASFKVKIKKSESIPAEKLPVVVRSDGESVNQPNKKYHLPDLNIGGLLIN